MTVRVVLAVVLAGALLAAAMPAVETAQDARAEQQLTASTDALVAAADTMVRQSDPVPSGIPGAQRRVRMTIPDSRDATIRLHNVPAPNETGAGQGEIVASVGDHSAEARRLRTPLRIRRDDGSFAPPDSTLVVRTDGSLWLTYRRLDGRPTLVVARDFK